MTDKTDSKERSEFEAHMRKLNACTRLERQSEAVGGNYRTISVQRAWELWQAACASLAASAVTNCERCSGSGEDPEGFYDQARGDAGHTHDGPCRTCNGSGVAASAGSEPVANNRPSLEAVFRGLSDRAYCNYIEQMGRNECLGWEYKVKHGKFGQAELKAHTLAGRLLGRHHAFAEAANALRGSGAPLTHPSPPEGMVGGWIALPGALPEPGVPVLLDIGKKYPIRAMWAAKHTVEAADDDTEWDEYDEATETYYCPEGWYEWNEHEDTNWAVSATPRAWAPLPPTSSADSRKGD